MVPCLSQSPIDNITIGVMRLGDGGWKPGLIKGKDGAELHCSDYEAAVELCEHLHLKMGYCKRTLRLASLAANMQLKADLSIAAARGSVIQ